MKRGNQALKPEPKGERLTLRPRKLEKVVRFSSSSGGASRVVKLKVSGILLLLRMCRNVR
jgi:hypothetical protein